MITAITHRKLGPLSDSAGSELLLYLRPKSSPSSSQKLFIFFQKGI
jgi:hypothetical protein